GPTDRLIDVAEQVNASTASGDPLAVARHCLLDWLGCTLGARDEPLARYLADELAGSGPPEASLIGRGERIRARDAALVNGATSHALDYDDTHMLMSGHPSVPVIPAALAVAERDQRSGLDLLLAIIAGVEVECRLGALMNPAHYMAGWHATGTHGCFGAAVATGHLLQLDRQQWRHAFGLAGTQAAGLKSGFGTMAKPLHAGKAASDGLLAASLAQRGFTANEKVIEAKLGLFHTQAPGVDQIDLSRLDAVEDHWCIADTLFKYHAACYLTHSAIEAALDLRAQGVEAGDVDLVELRVDPASLDSCGISEPATGLEAKFSLRGTVAMALLGDDMSDGASYSAERITSDEVTALRDRIEVVPTAGIVGTHSQVALADRTGQRHEASVDVGQPAVDLDAQWSKLSAKFGALVSPVLGADRAKDLLIAVEQLDASTQVADFVELCRG
ncbi:MAG: MmgE/PrpD family protein, partial [Actinomycetia bacterium]|nr:MmgE/PrpD family protein [Actinomycetes bacterium]